MNKYILCLMFLLVIISCDFTRIITATNHKSKIQTPNKIIHYLKKSNLDYLPVYCLDTSFYYSPFWWPSECIFNRQGEYLLIDPFRNKGGSICYDENYKNVIFRDIVENGDAKYISDSLALQFFVYDDSLKIQKSITRIFKIDLNEMAPYLRKLDGSKINIFNTYENYIVFKQFNLSGKSKLVRIVLKEQIDKINELNRISENNYTVALICLDRVDWMFQ